MFDCDIFCVPNCSKCGNLNDETARFCQACGSPLAVVQPSSPLLSSTPTPRKGLTYTQRWAVGIGAFLIISIITTAALYSSPSRVVFSPPNMKIQVSSSLCWTGSVGGSASSTVEGCSSKSWNFPNEDVVAGVFQLDNKCDFDYYGNYMCESGSLTTVIYHTNGGVCKEASTSAQFGVVSVSCSE